MFGKLGYQSFKAAKNSVDALNSSIENISNINSVGYKKGQVSFVETLNGEIAKQEDKDFSQGPLRRTGDMFDLALDGPGFFEVELPNGQRAYTRAGRLGLNSEGELITEEGYKVVPEVETANNLSVNEPGLNVKLTTPRLTISPELTPEITEDGIVNGINTVTGEKTKIGKINVVIFNNPNGLEPLGRSYYLPTTQSGSVKDLDIGPNTVSKIKQGFLELGNTDMVSEFMKISQMKNLLSAHFKVLKIVDKVYEQLNYTVSRSA